MISSVASCSGTIGDYEEKKKSANGISGDAFDAIFAAAMGSTSASAVAEPIEEDALFANDEDDESDESNQLIADYRNWKSEYFQRGISDDRRQQVTDVSAKFEKLLGDAAKANAFDDPKAFLRSLSSSDLKTLQDVHGLAFEIDIEKLSDEGAYNLLLSPDKAVDIDHDGFEMVGEAKRWQFPPSNAPDSVKQAWAAATANLSDRDEMLLQGSFMPIVIEGVTSASAYIEPNADYHAIVQKALEGAEFNRRFDEPLQRETRDRQIELLKTLLSELP